MFKTKLITTIPNIKPKTTISSSLLIEVLNNPCQSIVNKKTAPINNTTNAIPEINKYAVEIYVFAKL